MSGSLILVVLIVSQDASDPLVLSLGAAARKALGATDVVVRAVPQLPSDEEAIAGAETAEALAEISWADPEHRHATLRVHPRTASRWIDRDIGFDPSDADVERGRTLAFAVAAMLPDRPTPEPPPPPPVAKPQEAPPVQGWPRSRAAVDVLAAAEVGGVATGAGGMLTAKLLLGEHVALLASGGVLAGQDPAASASTLFAEVGGGLGWRALGVDARLRPGARFEVYAMHESLGRSGEADQGRWLPGASLLADAAWRLTPGAAVVLGVGGEAALGTTDVYVRGEKVSTIPALRLLGVAGLEASF